ncbi:4-hydroxythreonine-4-phosphate dehydrogenase PdxA [Neobacillus sp. Marseille-QA0830]
MGDASGVGPEIIMKALTHERVYDICHPFVIGDLNILQKAKEIINCDLELRSIEMPKDVSYNYGVVNCIDLNLLPYDLPFGKISEKAGDAAFQYLKKAIELSQKQQVDAICTAPLNKEALQKGGHLYPGHTEILADLTGSSDYAMMLSSPKLKVIHVTTHTGLINAVNIINPERVYKVINLAHQTLENAGIHKPRIAVCGINPHAGEGGLFGNGEEEDKIIPAVNQAIEEGINVAGPLPADTLFFRAVRGDFDIVVAMYHDQGHVPIKVLGLESGVNITVGLPIIRTSVDHGTAFDIAGKGIADENSMLEAIVQAKELAHYH